jgi:hypothetical protein
MARQRLVRRTVGVALLTLVQTSTALWAQEKITGQLALEADAFSGYAVAAYELQVAGGRLSITMSSSAVDSFLLLVDPSGSVRPDDDGGASGNDAEIVVEQATPGRWLAIATTYGAGDQGSFTLTVAGAKVSQPAGGREAVHAGIRVAQHSRRLRRASTPPGAASGASHAAAVSFGVDRKAARRRRRAGRVGRGRSQRI